MTIFDSIIEAAKKHRRPDDKEALALAECTDLDALMDAAEAIALDGFGRSVSYSRKVFVPLTKLCRDVCHYCTFAQPPRNLEKPYLTSDEVLSIAQAGAAAGCHELLFTLGDRPEARYQAARDALSDLGYNSTLAYLEAMAKLVIDETPLLPHLNPGIMRAEELRALRKVSVSMGIMLESASERLCQRGGVHFGSPDKDPKRRLQVVEDAGRQKIPMTSGILIGIGETRRERVESLLALRALNDRHGHIQEIIIQNFRAKPGTRMSDAPEPSLADHQWTIAMARILFGRTMAIQAPPNLQPNDMSGLIAAGINDWGGVSPVTPDHVNPEAPWPHLTALARETEKAGRVLTERLAVYPSYLLKSDAWIEPSLRQTALRCVDADGMVREDTWHAGMEMPLPFQLAPPTRAQSAAPETRRILENVTAGKAMTHAEITALFSARGVDFEAVIAAADRMRRQTVGDAVSYVVNRNINYTNICQYRCGFCAFSKGKTSEALRGPAYDLSEEEIGRRVGEAWDRGATEVCLQGGIHPRYTGDTYLRILAVVKEAAPDIHVHAFSPLEIVHGATTLGLSLRDYLMRLREAGLASLPGTAAEILDDEVRQLICPDKITTGQWLEVMRTAHEIGLRSTATIMFGHADQPYHWANHLLRLKALQDETGGFTELVPLPFVHMESPIWRKGLTRSGPTYREVILMHAVSRLTLGDCFKNIQASWVKLGPEGAQAALTAGANDFGGVLMNESITRSAGASHGQELGAARIRTLIEEIGRTPRQRTTLYGEAPASRQSLANSPAALAPIVNTRIGEQASQRPLSGS